MQDRKYIRLKNYDYSDIGYYYITICTDNRKNIFGNISEHTIKLTKCGEIIKEEWLELENIYKNIRLDKYIIMPNHIHGIIIIQSKNKFTIKDIIGRYKSITTKKYNKLEKIKNNQIWQRSYYEHIIRNEKELYRIQKYIIENPLRYEMDV